MPMGTPSGADAGLVVGGHHDLEARSVAEELAMKESGCDFIATADTLDQSCVESSFGAGFGCQDKSRASQCCEIIGDGVIPNVVVSAVWP